MDRTEITRAIKPVAVYAALVILVATLYSYSVSLIAVQTPWIDVVMGKATANTVLALVLWVTIVERVGKKRKWKSRTIWGLMMLGVITLTAIVQMTPLH